MNVQPAAHIPHVNGYNPLVPEYGDAVILASPSSRSKSFATLDDAIAAAKVESDQMDTAAGVFQAADGAYRLGLATLRTPEGAEDLVFGQDMANRVVFDDPALKALVWLENVARG